MPHSRGGQDSRRSSETQFHRASVLASRKSINKFSCKRQIVDRVWAAGTDRGVASRCRLPTSRPRNRIVGGFVRLSCVRLLGLFRRSWELWVGVGPRDFVSGLSFVNRETSTRIRRTRMRRIADEPPAYNNCPPPRTRRLVLICTMLAGSTYVMLRLQAGFRLRFR